MWPGSIPRLGVIRGLSLLVLYSAPRGFSPGTPVFPSPQKFDLCYFVDFSLQCPQLVLQSSIVVGGTSSFEIFHWLTYALFDFIFTIIFTSIYYSVLR